MRWRSDTKQWQQTHTGNYVRYIFSMTMDRKKMCASETFFGYRTSNVDLFKKPLFPFCHEDVVVRRRCSVKDTDGSFSWCYMDDCPLSTFFVVYSRWGVFLNDVRPLRNWVFKRLWIKSSLNYRQRGWTRETYTKHLFASRKMKKENCFAFYFRSRMEWMNEKNTTLQQQQSQKLRKIRITLALCVIRLRRRAYI